MVLNRSFAGEPQLTVLGLRLRSPGHATSCRFIRHNVYAGSLQLAGLAAGSGSDRGA